MSSCCSVKKAGFGFVEPQWLVEFAQRFRGKSFAKQDSRMQIAISLADESIRHGGGPFAAVIFSCSDWQPISFGCNLVVLYKSSMFHAEVVAILLAEQKLGSYSLRDIQKDGYELVTSTEPCTMCMGAVVWSGVRRLVCGARGSDAEKIGFYEGPKADNWQEELRGKSGIEVLSDICRADAIVVLEKYLRNNGKIY